MGTSVPPEPRWTSDSPAEQSVWRWAVAQLPDRVLVLPEVMITLGRGGRTEEAEVDLVLVDPEHGIVVVEVKGGTLLYDANRAVWRRREAGAAVIRDPVQQAKRARSYAQRALEGEGVDTAAIAMRWVVAVPDCRLDAPGEPVLHEAQLWDSQAVDQLELLWRRTSGALTGGERPLGEDAAARIMQVLRGRSRTGRQTVASSVDAHEERVRVLTESHRNVLHRFAGHPHVLVRGGAGTGKTVLALHAAVQYASLGNRVLLTCWNVVLSRWLLNELRRELHQIGSPLADEVTNDPTGRIVVSNVVDLARHATDETPPDNDSEWYYEKLPTRLSPAVTGGEFDVIVLDEAQDLTELWVLALSQLLTRQGRWYAFADGQQDLFHADAPLPDFLEVGHELRENFRNSTAIAQFASAFGDVELDCLSGDGPPVRFVSCASEDVIDETQAVARRLQREERIDDADLAVLWLFHNPHRGHATDLADHTLSGARVATNSASFKGMERPVVVLGLDIDTTKRRHDEVRRAIYAAATRARSLLVIVGDPEVAEGVGLDALAGQLRGGEAHG